MLSLITASKFTDWGPNEQTVLTRANDHSDSQIYDSDYKCIFCFWWYIPSKLSTKACINQTSIEHKCKWGV